MGIGLTSLDAALQYLFARTTGGFKFGLERTVALLKELGDPHRAYPSIHVAGTNGKGSSVATCDALLRARGLRVAKYTSPHLVDFRERMVVAGEAIPADAVIEFVERHTPLVEQLGATFFEATTALAFDWFARSSVDIAVIETGLGGRLDSTNVLDPVAAGVTAIGLDHTEYLGDTLPAIAIEKAGIFKDGRPAVIGEAEPAIRAVLESEARRHGAFPVRVVADESTIADIELADGGTSFTIEGALGRRRLWTPLAGRHQASNAAFALTLLDAAGGAYAVPLDEAAVSLRQVRLPGRFQYTPPYLFDVAHNPDGASVLAATLAASTVTRPVCALLSVLRDKDWRGMMAALAPVVSHFVLTTAPTSPESRAWSLAEVLDHARDEDISAEAIPDFDDALRVAAERAPTVLVTGSFHTVGDAMSRLQVSPFTG